MSRTWSVRILKLAVTAESYTVATGDVPFANLEFEGTFSLVVESPGTRDDVIHEVIRRWSYHLGSCAFIFAFHAGMKPHEVFQEQPYFYTS